MADVLPFPADVLPQTAQTIAKRESTAQPPDSKQLMSASQIKKAEIALTLS